MIEYIQYNTMDINSIPANPSCHMKVDAGLLEDNNDLSHVQVLEQRIDRLADLHLYTLRDRLNQQIQDEKVKLKFNQSGLNPTKDAPQFVYPTSTGNHSNQVTSENQAKFLTEERLNFFKRSVKNSLKTLCWSPGFEYCNIPPGSGFEQEVLDVAKTKCKQARKTFYACASSGWEYMTSVCQVQMSHFGDKVMSGENSLNAFNALHQCTAQRTVRYHYRSDPVWADLSSNFPNAPRRSEAFIMRFKRFFEDKQQQAERQASYQYVYANKPPQSSQ